MTDSHPKLRDDLVISRQGTGDAACLVVKDPTSGRFFRFGARESSIIEQLDGTNSLETLGRRVEGETGASLSAENLSRFTEKLRSLGLLETAEAGPVGPRTHGGRIGGSLLYLRVKAFNPDRLFDRLVERLRFCFTTGFVVGSAALLVFAAGITIVNWGEIGRDLAGLWRPETLVAAWLTVLVVVTAHEFAHGLTCKHFGGHVTDLGFLLLYFQPAFYCNVSDAWLFPEKSKRLWVTFAGAYFELVVWALTTVVWRVTEPGTAINFMALIVMLTSGVKTLFNLNPLIKLDGYYLLSDALEIPNLRQRAFRYLQSFLKRLRRATAEGLPHATTRERWIYVAYGLLAAVYSYWLLGWVLSWFGGMLVRRYQAWGFVCFIGLMTTVFRRPLARTAGKVRAMHVSKKKTIKWAASVAIVFGALYFGRMELRVAGEFKILPVQNADVRSEIEGIIEEVRVDEGDVVNKGDLIARLSSRDYLADLRKVKADIDEKQARLHMMKAGPRAEEVELAKTTVEKESERLKYGRERYDLYKALLDQSLVSKKEFGEIEEEAAVRQREYGEATGKLKVLLAGSRPEEIEEMEAEIAHLTTQQRYLDEQLQRVELFSPIAGVVTTPKLKEKIGQHVAKGDLITKVHELRTVVAEISVSEKEISDVCVGQPVVLKARAFPQRSFMGKVTSIAPTVSKPEEGKTTIETKTIVVRTQLDNPQLLLKTDMTGTAKISCGRQRLFDLLTRRLARYIRVEFWSWW